MTGIVSALIPDYAISLTGKIVDHTTLALIAPVQTYYRSYHFAPLDILYALSIDSAII